MIDAIIFGVLAGLVCGCLLTAVRLVINKGKWHP